VSQIGRLDTTEPTADGPVQGGETATVTIEKIVTGGLGLARLHGRVLLAPLTAPGDVVEVTVPERGSTARLVEMISPGPDRQSPPCAHYGICGGCDLMHLTYDAQLRVKLESTLETIERIGGAPLNDAEVEIVANPAPLHSRVRATWRPAPDGRLGYLRQGSHDVVAIDNCVIIDPALERVRMSVSGVGPIQALTNGADVSVAAGRGGAQEIEFNVLGESIVASADSFFQASRALLDQFVGYIVDVTEPQPGDSLLELFSGIGLLTVPLARRSGPIDAVESSAAAVALSRRNLARSGLENAMVHHSLVESWLRRSGKRVYPSVVLDPPRTVLGRPVVHWLTDALPARITYVSCDPATFARDARLLVSGGYRLRSLRLFDLFPQTHHVELVAAFGLER
jgi:23S rRNA (uracil1939-C5)-methyltransferase